MSSKGQILSDRIIGVINRTAPDAELYLYAFRARQDAKQISYWDENHSIPSLFELKPIMPHDLFYISI